MPTGAERTALEALYDATDGAHWMDSTHWKTDDGDWYGVTTNSSGNVTDLVLSFNELSGTIPAAVGGLTNLEQLDLSFNKKLSGPIPTELGNLTNLEQLALSNNALSGPIPTELGNLTQLIRLYLSNNALSGPIPTTLGNLSNLTQLNLINNKLSGPIPTTLGNLTNLAGLGLSDNDLSGPIPTELGNLTGLTALPLQNNALSGPIPTTLGNLTNLTTLYLYNNDLSGAIPPQLEELTLLTKLYLYDNKLSGDIPPQLGNLAKLTRLRLYNNKLSGTIPPQLGDLSNLTHLNLRDNNLSGDIPTQLEKLINLTELHLYNNTLSGTIPTTLGNLGSLTHLNLYDNNLSGDIPAALGNLANLTHLNLYDNNLSGDIPAALGDLGSLQRLHLHNNNLSGAIPAALGDLAKLTRLSLHNNARYSNTVLSGPLPDSFTRLTALRELHVQNTQVTLPSALDSWAANRTVTTGTQTSSDTIALAAANTTPTGVWANTTTLYVADAEAATVFAYNLATGLPDATTNIVLAAENTAPRGLWSNGTTLWVADYEAATVFAYTLADGSRDMDKDIPLDDANAFPQGLWSDGTTLWVVDYNAYPFKVFAYMADHSRDPAEDFLLARANTYQYGLVSDGTTAWVADSNDARLYTYTLADGRHAAAHYRILAPANAAPRGLALVGETLYVTDAAAATVYVYRSRRPQAVGTLPDQMLAVGGAGQTLTVTSAFRDPDGDVLTYTATSSDETVATVTVSGAEVSVQPVAIGTATVTVTATDADGANLTATQTFTVTVAAGPLSNQGPQAMGGLPDLKLTVRGLMPTTVAVRSVFRDPDKDVLTYTATSSDTRIATATVRMSTVTMSSNTRIATATVRMSSNTRIATTTVPLSGAEVEVRPIAGGTVTITVTATDEDGTNQSATQQFTVTVDGPPLPPPTRPPSGGGSGGGGGGGGGGGSGGGSQDRHGNTPARATAVSLSETAPWSSSTSGQINTRRDIDYFALTLPYAGVLLVETTGSTDTRGTVWQNDEELAHAESGGARRNFRLSVRVEAGLVVIAVEGNRTGAYTLQTTLLVGYLENPGAESFQSGIGVLSGWVCDAEEVEIEIGTLPVQVAAYGTERLDTEEICDDTDNGFGLLFNWNRLGDGEHTVVARVDEVELGRATVTVTTLGEEFLRGVEGECVVEDFPSPGEPVTLVWQQTQQNFVLAAGAAPEGSNRAGVAGVGYLENPGPNSFQSGVGIISGWVCEADEVLITLNGEPQPAAYGTERLDTESVCGDTDNGFGVLFNWNRLGDGEHTVVAWVDEVELGRATVRVTTLDHEFLRGAEGECVVEDFPDSGQTVTLEWQQNQQNFVIADVE